MKKQTIIALALLILLTTITFQQKIEISKFNIKRINIENNSILNEKDIKKLLTPIYEKNLILLNSSEIEKALMQSSYIDSYKIKKKYPETLNIKIFEKKPIAILVNKNQKFYLSEKIDLIKFKNLTNYQNLPYVIGNKDKFKIFYNNLKKINFPLNLVKKYILYDSDRWDLETIDQKLIKLPSQNYMKSIENYLNLKEDNNFKKYKVFDYRINKQLILK
tara:strand:- start:329 stop:985 length:657 start_codon:yes stop_codon:yes gene_type:complete